MLVSRSKYEKAREKLNRLNHQLRVADTLIAGVPSRSSIEAYFVERIGEVLHDIPDKALVVRARMASARNPALRDCILRTDFGGADEHTNQLLLQVSALHSFLCLMRCL
eukprot:m51a1_g8623 hypothetical protein (109) ;mRNA; r:86886-87212